MGTGIGGLPAWLLPTHCLHSLGILPPLQRAFRQCVGHVQAMVTALPGGLLACLVPTDCLRSLENRPPFHRALRQSVGNPEAIGPLYDNPRQQLDGNCSDLLCWAGQSFLSALKQSQWRPQKEQAPTRSCTMRPMNVHGEGREGSPGFAGQCS